MSTRLYRLFVEGNPQNRVFLPNLWMKLVKPEFEHPPNIVLFSVHPEMTNHDVREYLTKIYDLPVKDVRLRIRPGKLVDRNRSQFYDATHKEPDEKMAYVTMEKGFRFKFPHITFEREQQQTQQFMDKMEKKEQDMRPPDEQTYWHRRGVPEWF